MRRLITGAAVAVTACGGGDGGTRPPPQVANVVITAPSAAQTIPRCGTLSFAAEARDAQGGVISTATISWSSTDQSKVILADANGQSNTATGVGVGSSTITASANGGTVTSNGVNVNVQTGGQPSATADVNATASNTFSPSCVMITAGGTVRWTFAPTPPHNVKFQGSSRPTGGDIGDTQNTTVSRTFPAAGVYPYVCDLHRGMSGTVVVQ